jgi:hypothetical protein
LDQSKASNEGEGDWKSAMDLNFVVPASKNCSIYTRFDFPIEFDFDFDYGSASEFQKPSDLHK